MIELIQQHDDEPSVFGETLKARGAHGFHHWAIGARDFEKSVAHYRSLGYAEAFSDTAPMGFRVVYFDTTRDLPGMLEVIEMNAAAEQGFHAMYQAAQDWDGKTHIVTRSRRRNRHEPGAKLHCRGRRRALDLYFAHDLARKPVSTFRDHALAAAADESRAKMPAVREEIWSCR